MIKCREQVVDLSKKDEQAYNKRVKPRVLKIGDLVLKAAGHVQKGMLRNSLLSGKGHISFKNPTTIGTFLSLNLAQRDTWRPLTKSVKSYFA